EDAARLKAVFAGDIQTRVIELDGWLALGAHLPPKEKRGLVLVDPPFEEEGEFQRLVENLRRAHRRWPGGIYALWYPIKDRKAVAAFRAALKETGI
ncbi:MAG: 23S rRNA (adenine(2030)-N(6))-methyltransferase RlmJ, partial [Mesorhizobium sp.]